MALLMLLLLFVRSVSECAPMTFDSVPVRQYIPRFTVAVCIHNCLCSEVSTSMLHMDAHCTHTYFDPLIDDSFTFRCIHSIDTQHPKLMCKSELNGLNDFEYVNGVIRKAILMYTVTIKLKSIPVETRVRIRNYLEHIKYASQRSNRYFPKRNYANDKY